MRSKLRRAFLIAVLCSVSACTSTGATKRGVVNFNQVFADARNEILLLNILRARDGDPQQFSTVSNVNGSMRPSIGLTGALDNLTQGLAEVFKPSGTVTLRNPTVTIAPLETKEFRGGMMKPVSAELVGNLLESGWSPAVVMHLVMARKPCTKGDPSTDESVSLADSFGSWDATTATDPVLIRKVSLPAPVAAKMLREGAGKGITIETEDSQAEPNNRVKLLIKGPGKPAKPLIKWKSPVCSSNELEADKASFRSPLAMIQYLGRLTRDDHEDGSMGNAYFNIRLARAALPQYALVGTRFRDRLYFVPRAETDPVTKEAKVSRSAETLSLLAEIIGFQTMDATLNASKPTVTVPTE